MMPLIDGDDGRWQAVGTPEELTATLVDRLPPVLAEDDLVKLTALIVGCQPGDAILEVSEVEVL
ncbi:hypothetical protein V5S96_08055 [Corynebacterium mastitidis]|uniref:Uncharacterized protein n=1 Tax=Corynebacterium mastitidis TaxID=161890 RepID=A0ABU8NZ82_9CORY